MALSEVFGPERNCGEKLSTFRLFSKDTNKQLKAIIASSSLLSFLLLMSHKQKIFHLAEMLAMWQLSHPWRKKEKKNEKKINLEDWNNFGNP